MESMENLIGNNGKWDISIRQLENGTGNMYQEISIGIWHWKIELETLENSIENIGKWNWKHQPDSYHARTGHALPLKNSRVYKQLEKEQNPNRTK